MGLLHADGGVEQCKIRGPVGVEIKDGRINTAMERGFFPGAALLEMAGRRRPHHIFHGQGDPGQGMGL